MTTATATDPKEIVKHAQALERLRARRRKIVKALTELDDSIRTERKFLRDLTEPDATEPYRAPADEAP